MIQGHWKYLNKNIMDFKELLYKFGLDGYNIHRNSYMETRKIFIKMDRSYMILIIIVMIQLKRKKLHHQFFFQ